jgi:cbb3-type cytochrome c oxidase subunit III
MVIKSLARNLFCLSFAMVLAAGTVLAQDAADGAAIYKKRCSMCHGAEGKGFSANKTPDFTSEAWHKAHSDEVVTEVIKNGKKGTAMPAFSGKLSDDEIKAVVAHVRSFCKK